MATKVISERRRGQRDIKREQKQHLGRDKWRRKGRRNRRHMRAGPNFSSSISHPNSDLPFVLLLVRRQSSLPQFIPKSAFLPVLPMTLLHPFFYNFLH